MTYRHGRDGRAPRLVDIAIVGGGASGIAAAFALAKEGQRVVLLEAGPRLGGNCVGVAVDGADGQRHLIDLGVSDFNAHSFVAVKALLDELGVRYHPIVQDASFVHPDGTTLWLMRDGEPQFRVALRDERRFRQEIARFRDEAGEVLDDERLAGWTLQRYLQARGYSDEIWKLYLEPRAMGCFPVPDDDVANLPVRALVAFWRMHGLVGSTPSRRMVVEGGMHRYVRRFERAFVERGGRVLTSTAVLGVRRHDEHVEVRTRAASGDQEMLHVEHVIFATPPDIACRLLDDPSQAEREMLAAIPYQRAVVVAHQDAGSMPREREAWCAYNYVVPQGAAPRVRPTITFYPNRLASLPAEVPDVFVSMNPHAQPHPGKVVSIRLFEHPVFTARRRTPAAFEAIQGRRNTWYAGSYLCEPFVHEQAMASGLAAAEAILERRAPATARRWRETVPVGEHAADSCRPM